MQKSIFKTSEFWVAVLNLVVMLLALFGQTRTTIVWVTVVIFLLNFLIWIYRAFKKVNLIK